MFPIYDSASGARRRIFFNETEKVRKRNAKRQREGEIVLRSLDVSYLICAYRLPKSKSILRGLCLLLARLHPSFVLFFFFLYIYYDGARTSRRDREPRTISEISSCFCARKHDRRNRHRAIGGQRTKMYNNCVCPFYGWQRFVFSFYIYITCNKNDRSCKHVSRESEDF